MGLRGAVKSGALQAGVGLGAGRSARRRDARQRTGHINCDKYFVQSARRLVIAAPQHRLRSSQDRHAGMQTPFTVGNVTCKFDRLVDRQSINQLSIILHDQWIHSCETEDPLQRQEPLAADDRVDAVRRIRLLVCMQLHRRRGRCVRLLHQLQPVLSRGEVSSRVSARRTGPTVRRPGIAPTLAHSAAWSCRSAARNHEEPFEWQRA